MREKNILLILAASAATALFVATHAAQGQEAHVRIFNPYEIEKPYPYKASLHNHSAYHPEWTHAPVPTDRRIRDYRDYDTEPKYGIVSITEHTRVTTPWNTVPPGPRQPPWGVDNILWIPGNESVIGSRHQGDLFGELLIINASTEQTDELDWVLLEHSSARSGWVYESRGMPASVELTFTGVGFTWIARTDATGGIGAVYLNGERIGEADFYADSRAYNREVFALNGLADGEYRLRLEYDRKGESEQRFMGRISVDTLIIHQADGTTLDYGADHPTLTYAPYRYRHTAHPRGVGRGVEEPLRVLREDGCFLILPHPNSRLETSGEHEGTQIWTSSGYTYGELDLLFGNTEEGTPPLEYLPHALEIGNQGYDFSDRTGFQNAEEKWDYLLSQGHRILGTASDDSHGRTPFRGWIVVYTHAPTRSELTVDDVMDSLFAGNFYASQGPNMKIEIEDNRFTLHADQPALIEFISNGEVVHRQADALRATYVIRGDEGYVRGRVTRDDPSWRSIGGGIGQTRSAWTNPVYVVRD